MISNAAGHGRAPRRQAGFTMIEAVMAVALLALVSVAMSDVYGEGLRALAAGRVRAELDSAMRSRMETLLSQTVSELSSGSSAVTVQGRIYTITWTVAAVDLDGDTVADPTVRQLTVSADGRSFVTLTNDPQGLVGKL